jgi:phenylalanyl-tRNA synthetase beta chain
MKISINWLKQYLDINIPADELINGLIGIGFDLESVENQADLLKNFVIGKVLERQKHPNADKLSVCKVDVNGPEILNIVCGAPNVDAGQTVCVALVGAIVPNGGFEIKKSKIRGEVSEGMICSAKEMNLGDDHSGIMVLKDGTPIGSSYAQYLGHNDVIIDIGVTPNRGDLLSHIGVAREAGFLLKQKIKEPEIKTSSSFEGSDINNYISVEIQNAQGCNRYCGSLVKGVTVKESPDWLKNYLTSVGLRPINNIVDITNYVMMECGQPLHAFDYDLIGSKKIIVKNSGSTKKFTTLDGKQRELNENILLICDANGPVALAGIMGGANSEITNKTTNVFIESAYFDPVLTRKSSKFLGLQTDSSYRFERGIDIERTAWACKRAADLMASLCGGTIVSGIIDNYPAPKQQQSVSLRTAYLNKITGIELTSSQAKNLLEGIEINCIKDEADNSVFRIPYFRSEDLLREIDLVEEVLRLYGYEKITDSEFDKISFDIKDYSTKDFDFVNKVREHFVGRGFKEIITNTLVNEVNEKVIGDNFVRLLNPSSTEMNVLRTNLFIGAIESVKHNFNFSADSLKFFEVGTIFKINENGGVSEDKCILLTLAGEYDNNTFNQKARNFDILDIKGEVQALLEKLHIDSYNINYYNYTGNIDFEIEYSVKNDVFARITKFSDSYLKSFDIERPVIVCELR